MRRQHALIAWGVLALIFLVLWVPEYSSAARTADVQYWDEKWLNEFRRVWPQSSATAAAVGFPGTEGLLAHPEVKPYWDAYKYAQSPEAQRSLALVRRRGWQGAGILLVVAIGLYLGSNSEPGSGRGSEPGKRETLG